MTHGHRATPSAADRGIDRRRTRHTKVVRLVRWPGLDAIGQFFAMLGFPPGQRHALMAGLAETGGGLLALRLLTPAGTALVFSVVLVAAVSVHIKKGFLAQNGGYEYSLVLGVAALSLTFTGRGSLSLDALLGYSVSGALWGGVAFVVGLVGGAIQLAPRRSAPQSEPRKNPA